MQTTTVERIIAKIDNDFNPNNSDWIPRVGPWCIDVLQQLDVLLTDKVKKELTVKDRVARSNCDLDNLDIKVYDKNGCLIPNANDSKSCCGNSSSTGVEQKAPGCHIMRTPQTVEYEGYDGKPKMIGSHVGVKLIVIGFYPIVATLTLILIQIKYSLNMILLK